MERVTENLYVFGTSFNIYLLRGRRPALIEGGLSVLYDPLRKEVEALGVDIREVEMAFVLHAHVDHIMAFSPLKAAHPHVQICGSERARETLLRDRVWRRLVEVDRHISGRIASESGFPYKGEELRRFFIDRVLQDGEELEIGGNRIRVIYTPGHSLCAISLLVNDEVLLVSDSLGGWLIRRRGGLHPNHFYNLQDYLSSIERLSRIPSSILCLGHNGCVKGREKIEEFIGELREALNEIIKEVGEKVRTVEEFEAFSRDLAERWYVGFMRFFPRDLHFDSTRLLVKRTLAFLGREELLEALEARRNKRLGGYHEGDPFQRGQEL